MSFQTISLPTKNHMKSILKFSENVHYQTTPCDLVLDTLRLDEGVLSDTGALVIQTGEFTGRSPKDKFTVKDDVTADTVHWNEFNIPMDEKYYEILLCLC
jgi:phosphoenolpyruvate carboxykinase (ATP)